MAARARGVRGPDDDKLSDDVLQSAAATFGMLAATVRLHIVWLLAQGERDVTSLADEVGATVQVISQHLAKLRQAGLVRARRQGRHQVYLVDDQHLAGVVREMVAHLRGDLPDDHARRLGTAHGLGA